VLIRSTSNNDEEKKIESPPIMPLTLEEIKEEDQQFNGTLNINSLHSMHSDLSEIKSGLE
jgi:hypothetical protein